MEWETVIGLEVHVELSTKTKIFCGCSTEFGGAPNTHCCPICTGMPGTLPVLNRQVTEYALKAGLALGCEITKTNKFDRKNYFYPDLPKAYQISQLYLPFARNGFVLFKTKEGIEKRVGIHEIHMEEDAGKLIHSESGNETYTDYNRCGIPLLEIVSEPDMRSFEEVTAYLETLRSIFLYLGISDCKMQEGSMRADVNLSVRPKGETTLGTRTEMKNLNSFKAIERSIKYESARQIAILEEGGNVFQETRRWDDTKNISVAMRSKEDAEDYRYYPEPDIPPIIFSEEQINAIFDSLPEFAAKKVDRYCETFNLNRADAEILAQSKYLASLFEDTVALFNDPKEICNWMLGQLMFLLNENGKQPEDITISPQKFSEFLKIAKSDIINRQTAKDIFAVLFNDNSLDIDRYIKKNSLEQIDDSKAVLEAVQTVIAHNPKTVEQFKNGQTKVVGFFVGQVMKQLRGKAKPETVNKIVNQELSKLL